MKAGDKCWWRTPSGVMSAVQVLGEYNDGVTPRTVPGILYNPANQYRVQCLRTKYYYIVLGHNLTMFT